MPVGEYPLIHDPWSTKVCYDTKWDDQLVTKYRTDIAPEGSVHFVQNDQDERLAMISSTYYISQFWEVSTAEIVQVNALLEKLK